MVFYFACGGKLVVQIRSTFLIWIPLIFYAQFTYAQKKESVCICGIDCKCGFNCRCKKSASPANHLHKHQQAATHPFLIMMDSMMTAMNTVPVTDKLEENFLAQMIPHHQGAVEMAKFEIANGRDPEMLQLAKSILTEQQYEIQEMRTMLQLLDKTTLVKEEEYNSAMDKTMSVMMDAMPANDYKFRNIDMAFAQVMLPHHQAAIDMSMALLKLKPNKMLSIMAEKIISQQLVEVAQMKAYINK